MLTIQRDIVLYPVIGRIGILTSIVQNISVGMLLIRNILPNIAANAVLLIVRGFLPIVGYIIAKRHLSFAVDSMRDPVIIDRNTAE